MFTVHRQHEFSLWTLGITAPLKQTRLTLRPPESLVCLECGLGFGGRGASLTCHANWKMIPNANTHCVKHRAVRWFTCPCNLLASLCPGTNPFPVCLLEWPKIISTPRMFPDLSHILTLPRCQIWTPQDCLVSCLRKTHRESDFHSKRIFPQQNNTNLKITLDKIEPAMFVTF